MPLCYVTNTGYDSRESFREVYIISQSDCPSVPPMKEKISCFRLHLFCHLQLHFSLDQSKILLSGKGINTLTDKVHNKERNE